MMTKCVKYLLILNVVAFLIDMVMPALGNICALYYFDDPYGRFMPHQLVTYMFMHGDFMHIFFNMFALWMFGRIIEQSLGMKRFLIYYFVCGIGAALVQEVGQAIGLISPLSSTVGASGAIYGILLAFGMLYPNEKMFIIPIPVPIKAKWFVIGYAAIELFEGFHSSDGVAHFAHLGGMLFGIILILYWKEKANRPANYFDRQTKPKWKVRTNAKPSTGKVQTEGYNKDERSGNYGNGKFSHSADYQYNAEQQARNEQIDKILEKIRANGYSSLTAEEKKMLFDASNK